MSSTSEMLAAFDSLANAVTDIRVGNAIQKASKEAEGIRKNQKLSEFEQIEAQQSMASSTAAAIMAMGGNAAQAQQARLALAPNIPDQQMNLLRGTGKKTLAEAQMHLVEEADKRDLAKEERAFKRQKMLQDDQQAHAKALEGIKASGKAGKPISAPISKQLTELKDNLDQLKRLRADFDKNKGAVGVIDSMKTDKLPAFQIPGTELQLNPFALNTQEAVYRKDASDFFNQYRKWITGAAASVTELKGLEQAIPTVSDRQDVFSGTLDMHIKKVEEALVTRLKILKAQGRDTEDLEDVLGVSALTVPPASPSPGDPTNAAPPAASGGAIPGLTTIKKR